VRNGIGGEEWEKSGRRVGREWEESGRGDGRGLVRYHVVEQGCVSENLTLKSFPRHQDQRNRTRDT
jgi:hypothetical protein